MQRLQMTKNLVPSKASKHKPRQLHVQNKLLFVYAIISASFYFCTLICSSINTVLSTAKALWWPEATEPVTVFGVFGLYLKTAYKCNAPTVIDTMSMHSESSIKFYLVLTRQYSHPVENQVPTSIGAGFRFGHALSCRVHKIHHC